MPTNQIETTRQPVARQRQDRAAAARRSGFTLTELLVVITIIAVLAALITGAASAALRRAKEAAITLEAQQIAGVFEEIKNENGAYPPNVFSGVSSDLMLTLPERNLNETNLNLYMKRATPRTTGSANIVRLANVGLSPAEAVVFWLSGFSGDIQRPLSGVDLEVTTIDDNGSLVNNAITIDSFPEVRFDFDRGRLRLSRDGDGQRRFLRILRPDGSTEADIQLYEYFPEGSDEPYVYFDTSRESPLQVVNNWETTEFFYQSRNSGAGKVYPLKQYRPDAPEAVQNQLQNIEYVEKGRFQILHAGVDGFWGDFSAAGGELNVAPSNPAPIDNHNVTFLFPTGPFLGDIADNLGNFITGNLESAQE